MKTTRSRRTRSGSALVEFGISFAVLISVFTGTFQWGWTFYQYNVLKTAVNNGARYASLRPYDATTTTPCPSFQLAVQNMVMYGDPSGGTKTVVPGLTKQNVNVSAAFTFGAPSSMTVSISGYSINAAFGSMTLTNKPKVTYAYQGVYSPFGGC